MQACRELLAAAIQGQIIGLGLVVMLKRRRFMVDVCGEAERDPVFTRGALLDLDECLANIAKNKRDTNTTI